MHEKYLWHVTFVTSLWLIGAQTAITALWWTWKYMHVNLLTLVTVALSAQVLATLVLMRTTWRHNSILGRTASLSVVHDADLPPLTVAIPARNETQDLHDCITSLLASHYPKLEIIVLDDCSQTRRTPEIIRSFAHDGVRFIQGEQPRNAWLAKNQAYDALAKSANGELILFAGVDIRFDPTSLRQLVAYALSKHKTMVCVMPRNILPRGRVPLIQPMRYAWELVLPRRWIHRPPVLSSSWLITKKSLQQHGGFEAASRMVVPEAYFARRAAEHDKYSFIASANTFGITSVKNFADQRDTATRVAYPQTHRRPEMVVLLTLAYVLWVGLPIIAILHAAIGRVIDIGLILALCSLCINGAVYAMLYRLAYGKSPLVAVLSLPIAALVNVGLLNYSMYKYEFSEVIWKDRNVCLPVMHVIPRLPEI